ncbi:hypothetical protein SASPL_100320 [Salvia splendens]|uniref:Uncharacterized protein n=1 Tax=Salvia splendens TaxID=180675 RepID=A0A8X9ACC8_SALSN|nr:hypothetical protein SASPL_100320 [Salvia splendens]
MLEEQGTDPPLATIAAVVVVVVMVMPTLLGYQDKALTELLAEQLGLVRLQLLPIVLILTIQFLSSDTGSLVCAFFSTVIPNPIHLTKGSLLGVMVVLILGEAVTEFIAEMLSPVGLLLLPIVLLLTIQFLSSDTGSFVSTIFSTGEPNSIHRASGSPLGVAFVLILVLFLLYNRVSIFGGDDDGCD